MGYRQTLLKGEFNNMDTVHFYPERYSVSASWTGYAFAVGDKNRCNIDVTPNDLAGSFCKVVAINVPGFSYSSMYVYVEFFETGLRAFVPKWSLSREYAAPTDFPNYVSFGSLLRIKQTAPMVHPLFRDADRLRPITRSTPLYFWETEAYNPTVLKVAPYGYGDGYETAYTFNMRVDELETFSYMANPF